MNWLVIAIIVIVIIAIFWLWNQSKEETNTSPTDMPLQIINQVDLAKYAGLWHEIARLPNPFQDFQNDRCRDTTAEYTLNNNGTMTVDNKCVVNGNVIQTMGIGVPNKNTRLNGTILSPGSLLIKFNNNPEWGEYNIIYVDPSYQVALVGSRDRRYLWLLSRIKYMSPQNYKLLTDIAAKQGYPVPYLVRNYI